MEKQVQYDGYGDFVAKMAAGHSKQLKVLFDNATDAELGRIYRLDGIGAKVVDCIADDAVSPGFEITGDSDGKVQKTLSDIGFHDALGTTATWVRLFGGAIMVKGIADGRRLDEPAGKGKIVGFDVFSSAAIDIGVTDFEKNRESENYGKPNFFGVKVGNETIKVHYTRCVIFHGDLVPDDSESMSSATQNERIFGCSALKKGMSRLNRMGLSEEAISLLMQEANIDVFKLKDFGSTLSAKGGEDKVMRKYSFIERAKSICRAIVGDKDEEYTRLSSNFAGIPETFYRQMQMVAAAFDIPMARIYGEASSGLSTTGEGNRELYDKKCDSWRSKHLTGPMQKVIAEFCARNGQPKLSEIAWNSITKPTDKQFVEMLKMQTDSMHTLIQDGVVLPEEVRIMMFKNGHTFQMNLPEERTEE